MILTNAQERKRFLRFAVVGAIGAVVDFGVFNLLTSFAKFPAVVSSVISFLLAVISNFIWNRFWTYPESRSKPVYGQLLQFSIISLCGLLIRTPLFAFLEKQLTILAGGMLPADFFLTPVFIAHNVSLAIAILVVMLWNFFANRFWTYKDIK